MPEIVLKAKLDEFLARRVEKIIERGMFANEEEFLKGAIKEMVRKYEIQELNKKMDNFAQEMAKKHPRSLSEAVLAVRTEEDESL
ncbi:MAG TPA: hypothetical protein C5S37_10680 [Methanophagales archaeon]|nr:hypothetical protein [Methanophagales archaeon]